MNNFEYAFIYFEPLFALLAKKKQVKLMEVTPSPSEKNIPLGSGKPPCAFHFMDISHFVEIKPKQRKYYLYL